MSITSSSDEVYGFKESADCIIRGGGNAVIKKHCKHGKPAGAMHSPVLRLR